jgi:hypothetical protein
VFGLSTQDTAYQREAAERLHLPFPLLSDAELELTRALRLPTMQVAGLTLIKRLALIIDDGSITKVFYPVFPPDKNAAEVHTWLAEHQASMSEPPGAPADDGGARHLKRGRRMPDIALPTTAGAVSASRSCPAVRSSIAIRGPGGRASPTRRVGRHPGRARLHSAGRGLP